MNLISVTCLKWILSIRRGINPLLLGTQNRFYPLDVSTHCCWGLITDFIHWEMYYPTVVEDQKPILSIRICINSFLLRTKNQLKEGCEGIAIEVLLYGGVKLPAEIHHLISDIWLDTTVFQNGVYAMLFSLRKEKGDKLWKLQRYKPLGGVFWVFLQN